MSPLQCAFEQEYLRRKPRWWSTLKNRENRFNLTINLTGNEPRLVVLSNKQVFNHLAHKAANNKYKLINSRRHATAQATTGHLAPHNTTQFIMNDYLARQSMTTACNFDFDHVWHTSMATTVDK
jgi:hypothetical protein